MTSPTVLASEPQLVDGAQPGSPEWWLHRLSLKLLHEQIRYERLDRYSIGQHDLPEGDARVRETFARFQHKARTNFTGLVADAVRERLNVVGFRYGDAKDADAEADRIWQANALDSDSGLVHHAAGVFSVAYVIVGPTDPDLGVPLITPEDPRQIMVEMDPVYRRRVRCGMKMWVDEVDRRRHAVIYLPDSIHYFQTKATALPVAPALLPTTLGSSTYPLGLLVSSSMSWEESDPPIRNPLGEVPIVPFWNRRSFDRALGEFEDVIDIQDRINNTLLDRLVISKMQAYRQRYVQGITIETDEQGRPIAPFRPGVDLLWATESDTAKFGDFAESNPAGLLDAVLADVRDLAAVTRTPSHYFISEMNRVSGDSLKAAETGLVMKVRERMRYFGESWEQVMHLAFKYLGDTERAAVQNAETIWADPEIRSRAEMSDAAVKNMAAGVPWRQRMIDLQYSPQEIDRMEAERSVEAFLTMPVPSLPTPATTSPVTATGQVPPLLPGVGGVPGSSSNRPADRSQSTL